MIFVVFLVVFFAFLVVSGCFVKVSLCFYSDYVNSVRGICEVYLS